MNHDLNHSKLIESRRHHPEAETVCQYSSIPKDNHMTPIMSSLALLLSLFRFLEAQFTLLILLHLFPQTQTGNVLKFANSDQS